MAQVFDKDILLSPCKILVRISKFTRITMTILNLSCFVRNVSSLYPISPISLSFLQQSGVQPPISKRLLESGGPHKDPLKSSEHHTNTIPSVSQRGAPIEPRGVTLSNGKKFQSGGQLLRRNISDRVTSPNAAISAMNFFFLNSQQNS